MMNKDTHVFEIREILGINLKAISDYNNQNRDKIENINTIFSLKGQNKEIVLALLYLLASDEKDKALKKFRRETGLQDNIYNRTSGKITQHNLMLITALIFNSEFYAMAVHYYGAIKAGFPIGYTKEDSVPVPQANVSGAPQTSYEYLIAAIIFTFPKYSFKVSYSAFTDRNKGSNDSTEDFSAMINDYNQKIEANPNERDARIMRGLAYYKNGNWKKAIDDLLTVSEMNKGMEGVYYALGNCYYEIEKGKKVKAIEAFEKVKAIDPEFADINATLELLNELNES
jgi:tetratricopeptide (TPR) repeat protein